MVVQVTSPEHETMVSWGAMMRTRTMNRENIGSLWWFARSWKQLMLHSVDRKSLTTPKLPHILSLPSSSLLRSQPLLRQTWTSMHFSFIFSLSPSPNQFYYNEMHRLLITNSNRILLARIRPRLKRNRSWSISWTIFRANIPRPTIFASNWSFARLLFLHV